MKRKIVLLSTVIALASVLVTGLIFSSLNYRNLYLKIQQETITESDMLVEHLDATGLSGLDPSILSNQFQVILFSPQGEILFEKTAISAGTNSQELYTMLKDKTAEKGFVLSPNIDGSNQKQYAYTVSLSDGSFLFISQSMDSLNNSVTISVWIVILATLAMTCFAYLATSLLTKSIVKNINIIDINHPDDCETYDELSPLLYRMKQKNDEMTQQMAELEEEKTEFSAVTQNMDEGFLVLDKDGKVLSYNLSALKLLDTKNDEIVGTNILILNRSETFRIALQDAFQGHGGEWLVALSGRQCRLMVKPVFHQEAIQGIVLLMIDVTEKEERDKLRREFTANVSHELKTPLTAISGYAEIMLHGVAQPEDVPQFSQEIYQESQKMIALINDLMFLSNLEETSPLPVESVDLLESAQNAAERLKRKADKLQVSISVMGKPITISGIPSVLNEMIYNLLDNAIKYNKPNGTATISIYQAEDDAIITVKDSGIGIPNSEINRIFERFYRIDKSHNKLIDGTGLGLAIVKHSALLHKGKVTVSSDDNGTQFTITLPLNLKNL